MKHLSLFCLLLFTTALSAQNWRPIPKGYKAHFRIDTSSVITHSLWVDSTAVINGDSVFYLNRVVGVCDTCHIDPNSNCDQVPIPCIFRSDKHQFLQEQIIKHLDGSWEFHTPRSFVLYPNAPLHHRWVYDTARQITAAITAVQWKPVFQGMDSVKTILLSTGQVFEYAQNNGLLSFPDSLGVDSYVLEGLEGDFPRGNKGKQLPTFWGMFDFEVGDIFQRKQSILAIVIPQVLTNTPQHHLLKETILAKRQIGNRFEYEIEVLNRYETFKRPEWKWEYRSWKDTISWKSPSSNAYLVQGYPQQTSRIDQTEGVFVTQMVEDSLWGVGKSIGGLGIPYLSDSLLASWDSIWKHPELIAVPQQSNVFYPTPHFLRESVVLHPNLGITSAYHYNSQGPYEYETGEILQGYIHKGDTIGRIDADSFFLEFLVMDTMVIDTTVIDSMPVDTIPVDTMPTDTLIGDNLPPPPTGTLFHLAPNPTGGLMHLRWEALSEETFITVINPFGQTILTRKVLDTHSTTLDLSSLQRGVYYIRLRMGEKSAVKRFVIR